MKRVIALWCCLFVTGVQASDGQDLLDEFTISSAALDQEMRVRVAVPRTASHDTPLPVVYAVLGQVFLHEQAGLLSHLASGSGVPAFIVAVPLPDTSTPEGSSVFQVEGEQWNAYARFLESELPAAIESRYRVSSARHLLGFSVGAVMSLDLAMSHPGAFERAALISPGWMNWDQETAAIADNYTDRAIAQMRSGCDRATTSIWMNWGDGGADWERSSRDNGKRVIQALSTCGVSVDVGTSVAGDHGLHLIPPSLDEALRFLLSDV